MLPGYEEVKDMTNVSEGDESDQHSLVLGYYVRVAL
jgi:hypothetical protein